MPVLSAGGRESSEDSAEDSAPEGPEDLDGAAPALPHPCLLLALQHGPTFGGASVVRLQPHRRFTCGQRPSTKVGECELKNTVVCLVKERVAERVSTRYIWTQARHCVSSVLSRWLPLPFWGPIRVL